MASAGGQPAYPNPYLAPAPVPFEVFDKKVRFLGTVTMILAFLKLVVFGLWIVRSVATLAGVDDAPRHVPVRAIDRGLDAFHRTIAIWDVLRAVPFIAIGALLLTIAIRLQRGDATALMALRKWFFWSLGALAISICIQVFVTIPATLKWDTKAADWLPSLPMFDTKQMLSVLIVSLLVAGLVFGALLRLVIPIVLYVWAGRLRAEEKAGQLRLEARTV
jgi:hypothetical protein